MRADRDKRAAILTAEGVKQSADPHRRGREAVRHPARGRRGQGGGPARRGRGPGDPTVFEAIHAGDPDQKLLAYQYLQMLPKIAEGDANKLWIIPSELNDALKGLGGMIPGMSGNIAAPAAPSATAPAPRREVPPFDKD